jgi:hypothetical protein
MLGAALTGSAAQWTLVGIAITSFFTALGIWFKYGPDRTARRNEGDASLRSDLLSRISKLEEIQISDRATHAEERRLDRVLCDETTDELRQRIREQDKLIDGLQRQLIMFQVASGRALPLGQNSPEIEAMFSSLEGLYGNSATLKSDTLHSAEKTRDAATATVVQIKKDEA